MTYVSVILPFQLQLGTVYVRYHWYATHAPPLGTKVAVPATLVLSGGARVAHFTVFFLWLYNQKNINDCELKHCIMRSDVCLCVGPNFKGLASIHPKAGHFFVKRCHSCPALPYLTHSRLQVKGCTAESLLHVVVQGPGSFRVWSTFLYGIRLRSYGASKLPNFRILAIFPIQNA